MQNAKCNLRIATCRRPARRGSAQTPTSDLRPLTSRSGLTLIELLITITIIAVLAGMILGAASVAGETARESHTRHVITRLHTLLMQQLDTYKTRRVKLNPKVEEKINAMNISSAQKGQLRAIARLNATRELMMMEIPDRWSDLLLAAVPASNAGS